MVGNPEGVHDGIPDGAAEGDHDGIPDGAIVGDTSGGKEHTTDLEHGNFNLYAMILP